MQAQMQRKEEIEKDIEDKVNQLRKINVVLDHLKKKWDVETMKVCKQVCIDNRQLMYHWKPYNWHLWTQSFWTTTKNVERKFMKKSDEKKLLPTCIEKQSLTFESQYII